MLKYNLLTSSSSLHDGSSHDGPSRDLSCDLEDEVLASFITMRPRRELQTRVEVASAQPPRRSQYGQGGADNLHIFPIGDFLRSSSQGVHWWMIVYQRKGDVFAH